ncbi:MAG: hypothetical protein K0S07_184 [Chlamydiales bacterium]|nr:hypothetical protein [Chlamydiales bacterium]
MREEVLVFNHICFLVNTNLYDTKRYFVSCLVKACQRAGIHSSVIDSDAWNEVTAQKIAALNPDLTCSFNEVLPDEMGRFMWDDLQLPHLALIVDPVIYSLHLLKSPFSILTTVDRYDLELLKSFQFERSFFFPHAVDRDEMPGAEAERCYDAVFIGSCYDHEGLREEWRQRCSKRDSLLIEESVERVLADNSTFFVQALWNTLQERSVSLEEVDFHSLCFYTDYYLRGKDRFELIKSIEHVDLHLFGQPHPETPYGRSWQRYLERPNIHLHPPVSYVESLEVMKKAKFCLNSTPSFKNGTHPRIFAGMALESVVVTNDNQFFGEFYDDGKDILLYQHKQWHLLEEKLLSLLKEPEKRMAMAREGRRKTMQDHTFDSRVETLQRELPPLLEKLSCLVDE